MTLLSTFLASASHTLKAPTTHSFDSQKSSSISRRKVFVIHCECHSYFYSDLCFLTKIQIDKLIQCTSMLSVCLLSFTGNPAATEKKLELNLALEFRKMDIDTLQQAVSKISKYFTFISAFLSSFYSIFCIPQSLILIT